MTPPAGLLLLTGGQGRRFGGPKHTQPHPRGGTWGGHLVAVFQALFPEGPVRLLGERLPDRPGLTPVVDPGQGPAAALIHWAAREPERPLRWWVVACDQVRWTPEALAAWSAQAQAVDPAATRWVLARVEDHTQVLGGWLAGSLVPRVATLRASSLRALAGDLPVALVVGQGACWEDVDTPEALAGWLTGFPGSADEG